jgi:hypothetical protein
MPQLVRAYADTSIFGGVRDHEFAEASARFLGLARTGVVQLVVSGLVADEIEAGPETVRDAFADALAHAELAEVGHEAYALQRAYTDHGVVTERWAADALHVATASVALCSMIVSWNFRHIVNYHRIPLYNAVNTLMGYPPLAIHSPLEVRFDGEDV